MKSWVSVKNAIKRQNTTSTVIRSGATGILYCAKNALKSSVKFALRAVNSKDASNVKTRYMALQNNSSNKDNANRYPEIPKTWEELLNLRDYLSNCDALFLRGSDHQIEYNSHIGDLSRSTVLDLITDQMDGKNIALLVNAFPHYNILKNLPNVLHYCLWSKSGPLSKEQINHEVEKKFSGEKWFNMTRDKGYFSIPEIWHSHIYINAK